MDERETGTLEIHQTMLAELETPTKRFRGRGLFSALNALKTAPPTQDWLEASIMVGVIKRGRPYNTLAFINQLRAMPKTNEEKKRVEVFLTAVTEYLSPTLLTSHGYIEPESTFGQASHTEIWAGLESHMTILKDAGLKVFLDSGPLLGLVRDGKLIDHDNDIDLGLILDADSEETAALEWKKIPQKLRDLGILSEGSEKNQGLVRLTEVAGFTIDVFPAWFADNKAYVFPHTYGELKPEDVYPFRVCKITGLDQPAEPEKMLAVNYGSGWRTYDPLWKFVQPRGFDSFLARILPTEDPA